MEDSLRWSFDDGLWTAPSCATVDGWACHWNIEVAEDGKFGVTIRKFGVAPICHDWHPSLDCAKHQCECWEREFRNCGVGREPSEVELNWRSIGREVLSEMKVTECHSSRSCVDIHSSDSVGPSSVSRSKIEGLIQWYEEELAYYKGKWDTINLSKRGRLEACATFVTNLQDLLRS